VKLPWPLPLLLAMLMAAAPLARAHDVRPAYLAITERTDGALDIEFKQPAAISAANSLAPDFSTGWTRHEPAIERQNGDALLQTWRIPAPHVPLEGARLRVLGLESTITDVLVRVTYADGTELTRVLTPKDSAFAIPGAAKAGLPVREYLQLGFTHIWSGVDHLLYVAGLVLLIRSRRALIKTITAFTLAHSVTLAAATLGVVTVPSAPVEAVIALSIVYVAVELARARAGQAGLTQRAPWLVALSFGLLHGLGFAGALSEVGLPAQAVPLALALFNVGIEAGQLAFVALLLLAASLLRRAAPTALARLHPVPAYSIGSLASFWLIERIHAFI
jgi:hydrogenase/urease accessory protein HupE